MFFDGEGGISLAEVIGTTDAGGAGGDGGAGGGGDASGAADDTAGAGGDRAAGDGGDSDASKDRGRQGADDAAAGGDRKGKDDAADKDADRIDDKGKDKEDVDDKGDEEEVTGADGRKVADAALRRGIANLRKTDKAAGKAVADAYFANQDVVKAVGAQNVRQAVVQVRAMKATLDSLGGDQGITDMRTEIDDWRTEGKQFVAGDMALIEKLAEADPNALHLTSANALDWLGANKPELFDKTLLPHMVSKLESVGFNQVLENIAGLLEKGKGQEAYDLLHKMRLWSNDIKSKAEKFRGDRAAAAKKDPRDEAFQRKDEEYARRDQEIFGQDVNRTLTRLNNDVLDDTTKELFSELKLNNEGKRDFLQGLMQRIWTKIEKDKHYQSAAKSILAKKDPQEAAEFIHSKFNELLPDEFIAYRNIRYPGASRTKKAATGENANGNGKRDNANGAARGAAAAAGSGKPGSTAQMAILLRDGEMPTKGQVDWKDPNAQVNYIGGRAKLTNGKYVRWRVNHHGAN